MIIVLGHEAVAIVRRGHWDRVVSTLFDTQKGPVIGSFHEYVHIGKGRSIHAAGQIEWFN